jgi:hypothetical protein
MKTISCTGRYDGKVVQLDEQIDIPKNAAVIVTVLPNISGEEAEWHRASLGGVGAAYAPNEPEYPLTALKEQNPDYAGR